MIILEGDLLASERYNAMEKPHPDGYHEIDPEKNEMDIHRFQGE